MCGRYSNHVKAMLDWSSLLGDWPEEVPESHNIAPGQMVVGFTANGGHAMRWGLIPGWADGDSGKYSTFNARIETVASKPAYRNAWRHANRCLLPALGYYEWQARADGKQPYFIHRDDEQPLLFAGLFEPARNDSGIPMSCTMLTCAARKDLAHIHPRMPIMVSLEQGRDWLAAESEQAAAILERPLELPVESYAVSKRVNNARNEGADLIDPITL